MGSEIMAVLQRKEHGDLRWQCGREGSMGI